MDAQIESLVELYLTRGGRVFLSPQYDVAFDKEARDGGSCPDFVALDMEHREVIIVEVTSASNLTSLCQRVTERKTRWFEPIRRRMEGDKIINPEWKMRFIGFVRENLAVEAKAIFAIDADVCFFPIEKAAFSFAYWADREKGLPR